MAVGVLGLLAGCSSLEGTNEGGYVPGAGQVAEFAAGDRGEPVELVGTTLDGDELDLADVRGKVVVVNVWWSGCGPCRKEMPMLTEAAGDLGDEVAFVGINTRDPSADTARAFEREYAVTYPSIYASDDSTPLLAFEGAARPVSMPTTLLLDREGRVAAKVNGPIPSQGTLTTLVEDLLQESPDG